MLHVRFAFFCHGINLGDGARGAGAVEHIVPKLLMGNHAAEGYIPTGIQVVFDHGRGVAASENFFFAAVSFDEHVLESADTQRDFAVIDVIDDELGTGFQLTDTTVAFDRQHRLAAE